MGIDFVIPGPCPSRMEVIEKIIIRIDEIIPFWNEVAQFLTVGFVFPGITEGDDLIDIGIYNRFGPRLFVWVFLFG